MIRCASCRSWADEGEDECSCCGEKLVAASKASVDLARLPKPEAPKRPEVPKKPEPTARTPRKKRARAVADSKPESSTTEIPIVVPPSTRFVVYAASGPPPAHLGSTDRDAVLAWVRAVEAAQPQYVFTATALDLWVRHFYIVGSEEHRAVKAIIDSIVKPSGEA